MSYGQAERKVVNEVSDPETLCCLIGQMPQYIEMAKQIREQMATADESVGQFTGKSGFSGWGQRVGWIPQELFVAVERVFPGFFKDQGRRDRFLRENPIFDLRTRVK